MENGYSGVSNNDAGTLALLSGGYGGVGIGGGRGGFEFDGSVVNNGINRNADTMREQHNVIREQVREQGVDNKLNTLLFQNNDFRRESQQQINDARAEAAKCCCETQLLVTKENNETRTLMLEQRIAQQDNNTNAAGQVAILNAINALAVALTPR